MAGTININQLLTEDILLSDFIVKADANGLATKTTIQELSNKITTTGDLAFKGKVSSTDATVSSDGWYFAEDSGTYTNNGGLVIDLANNLAIIIVSNTQATFSKIDIPLNITFDATPTEGSINAVTSDGIADALDLKADQSNLIKIANTTSIYNENGTENAYTLIQHTLTNVGDYFEAQARGLGLIATNNSYLAAPNISFHKFGWQNDNSIQLRLFSNVIVTFDVTGVNRADNLLYKLVRTADGYELFIGGVSKGTVVHDYDFVIHSIASNLSNPTYDYWEIEYVNISVNSVLTSYTNLGLLDESVNVVTEDLNATKEDLLTKANINGDNTEIFKVSKGLTNDDAVNFSQIADITPRESSGINLFDKTNITEGFYILANGDYSPNASYGYSDFIKLNGEKQIIINKAKSSSVFGLNIYNSSKTLISTISQSSEIFDFSIIYDAYYFQFGFLLTDLDTIQANLGIAIFDYTPFQSKIDYNFLPNSVNDNLEVVLPPTVYVLKDKNAEIYYDNILLKNTNDKKVDVVVGGGAIGYKKFFHYTKSTAGINNVSVQVHKNLQNRFYNYQKFEVVDFLPSNTKSINIMNVGDSFTDFGQSQEELKSMLEAKGVTVNQIGTKGQTNRRSEFQSGATMEQIILNPYAQERILAVSGVTVEPSSNFGGSIYEIGGVALSITLVVLDVNGDGFIGISRTNSADFSPEIPTSGSISKTDGLGDTTINYTSFELSFRNHFWNPSTLELDFSYYINKWGFNNPDLMILQFTYNDVKNYATESEIDQIVLNAKTIIDQFNTEYPSAYVIFSIEPCGASSDLVSTDGRLKSFHEFTKKMIIQFSENTSYNGFVFINPAYAYVDRVNGYGTSAPITPSIRLPLLEETVTKDPVHPSIDVGMLQIADSWEATVHKVISLLP